jgi:inner membrane protein involved in colicin E2 resistance
MRLIWVGLLALLSHIPIGMIGGLISERERIKKRTMRKRKKEYLAASAA